MGGGGQRSLSTTGDIMGQQCVAHIHTQPKAPPPPMQVAALQLRPGKEKSNKRALAIKPPWPHSTFKEGISLTFDPSSIPPHSFLSPAPPPLPFPAPLHPNPPTPLSPLSGPQNLFPEPPRPPLLCLPLLPRGSRRERQLKSPPGTLASAVWR